MRNRSQGTLPNLRMTMATIITITTVMIMIMATRR
jgi:hypothetical protein